MSRRRKILLPLGGDVGDYITRVKADSGTVERPHCIKALDADFVMYPSGYKASTLYSQVGIDGVDDFTVTRASVATRIDKNGLIEEVAADVPRLDYSDSTCPVLLLEPQSINLFLNSEPTEAEGSSADVTYESFDWGVIGFGDCIRYDSAGILSLHYGATVVETNTYSISFYVKMDDLSQPSLEGDDATTDLTFVIGGSVFAGVDADSIDMGNGVWRVSATGAAGSGLTSNGLLVKTGYSGKPFRITGLQIEELGYPTSYIETTGATFTRLADVVNSAGDVDSFDSTEGVLYVEMAALFADGTNRAVGLNDGTDDNIVRIFYDAGNTLIQYQVKLGGATQAIGSFAITQTASGKFAVRYSLDDFSLWVDGTKESEDLSGSVFAADVLDQVSFDGGGGTLPLYAKVKVLKVFKTALTDQQMEDLTTNGEI